MEEQQLGQEGRPPGQEGCPHRLRPLQGHAPQEARPLRGAQGSGQGQGLGIDDNDFDGSIKRNLWDCFGVACIEGTGVKLEQTWKERGFFDAVSVCGKRFSPLEWIA